MRPSPCRSLENTALCLVGVLAAASWWTGAPPTRAAALDGVAYPVAAERRAEQSSTTSPTWGDGVPQFAAVPDRAGIAFEHHYGSSEKRYITEMAGSGGAWLDYDVDGRLDLLLVDGLTGPAEDPVGASRRALAGDVEAAGANAGHRLFRNTGTEFVEVPASGGLRERVWGNGAAVGDIDNDGYADLLITAIGPDRLFRNNGDGTFVLVEAGLDDGWGTSAAFTDWDNDGFLDLYVAKYIEFDADITPALGDHKCFYRGIEVLCGPEGLIGSQDRFYRNLGDGTRVGAGTSGQRGALFTPWPGADVDPEATYGFAVIATDCDGDFRPEIYVADDVTINLLYRRTEVGGLEDWSLFSGAGYSLDGREQSGMGTTAADYDGDGLFDLFVTNFQGDYNTIYRNLGDCSFEDVTERLGLATSAFDYLAWAAHFVDIDGDADQDLFVANGHIYPQVEAEGLEEYKQRNLLYLNQLAETGSADFIEVGESAGPGMSLLESSRAALLGDYDNDGDQDFLITNINSKPSLLRNDGPVASPALRLTLVGRSSNRSAYGARVTVASGGKRQELELRASDGYAGSNDPRLLVHLPGGSAEALEVRWPSGQTTQLRDLPPGWLIIDEDRSVVAKREM